MARFNVKGFDELLEELERIGKLDDVAPKMLEAGVKPLQEKVIEESSKHKDTGAMMESIKPTAPSRQSDGSHYICTRPTGKDKKGVRNMAKMCYLEFGVKGRPATPIITAAVVRAEAETIQAMQDVFSREIGAQ